MLGPLGAEQRSGGGGGQLSLEIYNTSRTQALKVHTKYHTYVVGSRSAQLLNTTPPISSTSPCPPSTYVSNLAIRERQTDRHTRQTRQRRTDKERKASPSGGLTQEEDLAVDQQLERYLEAAPLAPAQVTRLRVRAPVQRSLIHRPGVRHLICTTQT